MKQKKNKGGETRTNDEKKEHMNIQKREFENKFII